MQRRSQLAEIIAEEALHPLVLILLHSLGQSLISCITVTAAGAYVIVINAEKVTIGGRKAQQKKYYRHSGQPGGLKTETFEHLQKVNLVSLLAGTCTTVSLPSLHCLL